MSNFQTIPSYNDEMRKLETTDPAHADVFNTLFQQLINNDAFLKVSSEGFGIINIAAKFGIKGGFQLDSNNKPIKSAANDLIDDSPKIQAALNWANSQGGATLYLPALPNKKAYAIKSALIIYENTQLILSNGATIVRNAALPAFFYNGVLGANYYGYKGFGNITFAGGTLEGNSDNIEQKFNFFSIGHSENVVISNVKMLNLLTYHCIEINSSRKVTVEGCTFDGFRVDANYNASNPGRRSEAIQIDGAFGSDVFGGFGAYDNTPCSDVTIMGCTFRNWDRGVGSHTGFTGRTHQNIRVVNNHFEGLSGEAIISCMWDSVVIEGNTLDGVRKGVYLRVKDSTDLVRNYVISNNVFKNMIDNDSARHAVHIASNFQIEDITVDGNVFFNASQTMIYCESVKKITVTDNALNSSGAGGIYFFNSNQVTISDNAINNVKSSGIFLENSKSNVISANNILNCGKSAIALSTASSDNNVTGNVMRNINEDDADYHFIFVTTGSNDNLFTGNIARGSRGSANLGYGLRISSACSGNAAFANSFKSASIYDTGNSTLANNA